MRESCHVSRGSTETGRGNPSNRSRRCASRIRSQTLPFWQPTDPNGPSTDPNGPSSDPNGTSSDPNGTTSDPNGPTTDPQYDGKSRRTTAIPQNPRQGRLVTPRLDVPRRRRQNA